MTIWDDHSGGFHTTVARITGRDGNRFSIDADLMSDYMVSGHAQAATVYPVVGGTDIRSARVEDLVIEGNKQANPHLNGCRARGSTSTGASASRSRAASCGTSTATGSASSNPTT